MRKYENTFENSLLLSFDSAQDDGAEISFRVNDL